LAIIYINYLDFDYTPLIWKEIAMRTKPPAGRPKRKNLTKAHAKKAYSYLRVSTADQSVDKFKNEVLRYANQKNLGQVTFFEDKISGTTSWRKRKVAVILDELGPGDRLIVPELSRLGRSTVEILEILNIAKSKGIEIHSLKPAFIVDDSMSGKVMATMFALMAELERDLISMRTKEALQARKKAGVILGRPKGPGKSKLDPFRDEIIALLRNGSQKKFVAQRYGTTPANLHLWIKKHDLNVSPVVNHKNG
jgi:DNA invertase Pin-like site-specific DNA recombinase